MRPVHAVLVALCAATAGCKCDRDHPYVPYGIAEASVAAADDAGLALARSLDAGPFRAQDAAVAPAGAQRFTVEGLDLAAPPDRVVVLALVGDFDGDGARDAAALVAAATPADDAGVDPGSLVLYRGHADGSLDAPVTIATPPPLVSDASCAPKRRLAQVGRHTLFVETGATCADRAAARWVAALVVRDRDAPVHFQATLVDPPLASPLTVDVDGADRDGDGLDDVTVRASIEGGAAPFEPGPRVTATLRWLDRVTGMSRDPDEPEASFRALATSQGARATKSKEAANVVRAAEQLTALVRALCVEGGTPRMVDLATGEHALSCGTSKGLFESDLAEARAEVTLGDGLRAIAALDRAQIPPAARVATRVSEAQGWVTQAVPVAQPAGPLRVVAALPAIDRGAAPAWSALAFEPNGALLVRTLSGVVRVDPVQGGEAAASDVGPWPSAVTAPDGAHRWIEAYDACDGRALHATLAPVAAQGEPRDVVLPIAPLLGPRCATAGAHGVPAPALPVAWDPRGLTALVQGELVVMTPDLVHAMPLVAPLDQPVTLGAPRSPNGRAFVAPTSMGLFVRGARPRLLRAPELEGGWLELRDCAVSDDASRVACVRGGRAFVGVWPPE